MEVRGAEEAAMITTRPGYPRWHTARAQGPRSLNAAAVGAYAADGTTLGRLTTDHTLAEYFRARHQPVTPRMEHVVTTSVRTAGPEEIGTAETSCVGLLLTSDGVHTPLTGSGLRAVLARPGTGAAELVEAALARGGSDNATAVYVEPLEADSTSVRFPVAA